MRKTLALALLVGSSVVFTACTHQMETPVTTNDTTTNNAVATSSPAPAASPAAEVTTDADTQVTSDEIKEFTLEAGSFYFKPNEIRVKKGDTVRITMNAVSMMHNFVIDELNVEMPIVQNGKSGTVEFLANEAGEFEFYCSVGSHRAQGQVGTLIVEE